MSPWSSGEHSEYSARVTIPELEYASSTVCMDENLPPNVIVRKRKSKAVTKHFIMSSLWGEGTKRAGPLLWARRLYATATAYLMCEPVACAWAAACIAIVLVLGLTSVVAHVRYVQDPDKELMPWRKMCANQPAFVNAAVADVDPVSLFVGVMSVDKDFERRSVIRDTYVRHTQPRMPNGHALGNVQVKFVLGRPRKEYAHQVALEMEMYNDVVVLDMRETQWSRKTANFFQWAAQNATVPVLIPSSSPSAVRVGEHTYEVREKLVDYVLKADDDVFIVLDELERRLRATPRQLVHWGYKIKDWFMGGEVYALSQDLVQFLASSRTVAQWPSLKEDEQLAKWLALHPRANEIVWATEHCWIYDHPRAATPYAHGFLFPDHVEVIKKEYRDGLSSAEVARRGGKHAADAYSTTTQWGKAYTPPSQALRTDEAVEALVEGGGRWHAHAWRHAQHEPDAPFSMPRRDILAANATQSLKVLYDASGLAILPHAVRGMGYASGAMPVWGPPMRTHADELRRARYLNYTLGGTVAVHYLKHHSWFYETLLGLLGSQLTWAYGSAANAWRTHYSPLVQPYSRDVLMISV